MERRILGNLKGVGGKRLPRLVQSTRSGLSAITSASYSLTATFAAGTGLRCIECRSSLRPRAEAALVCLAADLAVASTLDSGSRAAVHRRFSMVVTSVHTDFPSDATFALCGRAGVEQSGVKTNPFPPDAGPHHGRGLVGVP